MHGKNKTWLLFLLLLFSCATQGNEESGDLNYITGVKVLSHPVEEVKIDNFRRTIELFFEHADDLDSMELEFILANDARMVQPQSTRALFDLTGKQLIQVEKNNRIVSYSIVSIIRSSSFPLSAEEWEQQKGYGDLPDYLALFKYRKDLPEKQVNAYVAVADIKPGKGSFKVLGEKTGSSATPAQFYSQQSQPRALLNGGYFWSGNSLGLIIRDGVTIVHAQPVVNRSYNGVQTPYYPTQGAFGSEHDGTFTARWVYESNRSLYSYPAPAPNVAGEMPLPVPSSSFPEGAAAWEPNHAIGAGPLLIKDGKYQNQWLHELFDASSGVGPTASHPRSAIAYHPGGFLLFFVCEGRNKTPNTPGMTLREVADILLATGCTQAINLDGGGSSCLLVNGKETILPSDGKQRAITNMVAIY